MVHFCIFFFLKHILECFIPAIPIIDVLHKVYYFIRYISYVWFYPLETLTCFDRYQTYGADDGFVVFSFVLLFVHVENYFDFFIVEFLVAVEFFGLLFRWFIFLNVEVSERGVLRSDNRVASSWWLQIRSTL